MCKLEMRRQLDDSIWDSYLVWKIGLNDLGRSAQRDSDISIV